MGVVGLQIVHEIQMDAAQPDLLGAPPFPMDPRIVGGPVGHLHCAISPSTELMGHMGKQ